MSSELDELVELLRKTVIQDVRYKGWEYILSLTGTDEGIHSLLTQKFIPFVVYCITEYPKENQSILPLVYKCVINLSSNDEGAQQLLSHKQEFMPYLLQKLCDPAFEYVESTCYILNNLSSHGDLWDAVSNDLTDQINNLTKLFLSNDREKYRFLAMIFSNITKQVNGRRYFLEVNNLLYEFFSTCANPEESIIRRLGVSLTLRNCCFETDYHQKLLKDFNILPNILLPLMGPEDYDAEEMEALPIDCQLLEATKVREQHPKVRKALIHALCLLCYTEEGWNFLKDSGVYYVTRELHKWETDESVNEAIETLVLYMLVENYQSINDTITTGQHVIPSETDVIRDLPDFIV